MAGKRHHYIPRFLQSGFAKIDSRGTRRIWMFRRDGSSFQTSTVNAGIEGQFYTYDENDADQVITEVEADFSELVSALRAGSRSALQDPLIPGMLTHFETRTRQFRENLLRLGNQAVDGLLGLLAAESGADRFAEYARNNPSLLREELEEVISARNLRPDLLPHLEALAPQLLKATHDRTVAMFTTMRPLLAEQFSKAAKAAHVKSLQEAPSPPKRSARLIHLRYEVAPIEAGSLVLGDAIVLFQVREGLREYKNTLERKDRLRTVYLPLSSSLVLLGTEEDKAVVPVDLPRHIARCSLECFLAEDDSTEIRALHGEIGRSAAFLEAAKIEKLLESTFPLPNAGP